MPPSPTAPKPYTTFDQQIELLQTRGLKISAPARAADYLRRIGYYRISGYCKPFRVANSESFVSGASFENVVALYLFDKRLRLAMTDALERIEIAVRAEIAAQMGAKNPQAHLDFDCLRVESRNQKLLNTSSEAFNAWRKMHEEQMIRHCRDEIVNHHRLKYGTLPPIWASVELWSFGMLARFYKLMRPEDRRVVATRFGVVKMEFLQSWLDAMGFARNVSAHHGRLWNRGVIWRPKLPAPGDIAEFDPPQTKGKQASGRIYSVLCVVVFLLRRICPRSEWPRRLRCLMEDFPVAPGRSLSEMGFPPEWKNSDFWNR